MTKKKMITLIFLFLIFLLNFQKEYYAQHLENTTPLVSKHIDLFKVLVNKKLQDKAISTSLCYIPEIAKLPNYLLERRDNQSKNIVEVSLQDRRVFDKKQIPYFGTTYLNKSKPSWNEKDLDYFSKLLLESKNVNGYIIIYTNEKPINRNLTFWVKTIKSYLIIENHLSTKRLFLMKGGYRHNSMAELFIIPKHLKPPMPTPENFKK